MSIRDLAVPATLEEDLRDFERLVEGGRLAKEFHVRRKDGEDRIFQLDAVRLGKDRVIGFCSDITDLSSMDRSCLVSTSFCSASFSSGSTLTFHWGASFRLAGYW